MADISLVIDRSKGVFAFSPLNQLAKKWFEQNSTSLKVVLFENAFLSDESALLENLNNLMTNDLYVEVWKSF